MVQEHFIYFFNIVIAYEIKSAFDICQIGQEISVWKKVAIVEDIITTGWIGLLSVDGP